MTFRGTTNTTLDVVRNLIDEVDTLKRQVGSIKQNTIRLSDWVIEMENDTVIKTTNLTTGIVSYIGLPIDPVENIFDQKWSYSGTVNPSSNTPGQRWPSQFYCQVKSLFLTLQTASSSSYTINTYVNDALIKSSTLASATEEQEFSLQITLFPGDYLYPEIVANAAGNGTQLGMVYRMVETTPT